MKITEQQMNDAIEEACKHTDKFSSEVKNAINACRKGSKLSSGSRSTDFRNAAFMLSGSCPYELVIKFNKIGVSLID